MRVKKLRRKLRTLQKI